MSNESTTRVPFAEIFRSGQNGSLITKVPIRISTARFEAGTIVEKGALLGGVNFHQHIDRDIAVVKTTNGVYIIAGIYLPE